MRTCFFYALNFPNIQMKFGLYQKHMVQMLAVLSSTFSLWYIFRMYSAECFITMQKQLKHCYRLCFPVNVCGHDLSLILNDFILKGFVTWHTTQLWHKHYNSNAKKSLYTQRKCYSSITWFSLLKCSPNDVSKSICVVLIVWNNFLCHRNQEEYWLLI